MNPKLPVIRARGVIRVAVKTGFVFDRKKGSHAVYYRERDKARIVIPIHARKTIKSKTLANIIGDMGLTVEEFRNLL